MSPRQKLNVFYYYEEVCCNFVSMRSRTPRTNYACILHALMYRVAEKSKPPPIFQKIALKIASEIRFLRKVKV